MAAGGFNVGGIYGTAGLHLDDSGFDRFERRLEGARREARRGVETRARVDVDERGFRRYESNLNQAERHAHKTGRGISAGLNAGALASRGLGAAAAGAGAALVGVLVAGSNFEKQMSEVKAVTGATADEMKTLSAQARELGTATGLGAGKAAQAIAELGKGGLSTKEIIGGGLRGAMSLAAAGGLELADAASTVANGLNLFGLEGKDAAHIADAFATAANATTADVGDFAMALSQGGAAAKAAGLDFDQTTVILEALAANGVKNSDAGTSLKTTLSQLAKPTKQAAAEMERLNLHFFDAHGKFRDLGAISKDLGRAFGDMSAKQRLQTAYTIAGSDGMRTLLSLYSTGPKRLDSFAAGLHKSGTAADVARQKQDNLAGAGKRLRASLENVAIGAFQKASPALTDITNKTSDLINSFGKAGTGSGRFGATIGQAAKGIGAAFATLGGGWAKFVKENRDTLDEIGRNFTEGFGLVKVAVGGVADVIRDTFGSGSGTGKDLRDIGRVVLQVEKVFQDVFLGIARRTIPPLLTAIRGIALVVRGVIRIISGVLHGDFRKAFSGLGDIVGGALRVVAGALRGAVAPFSGIASKIGEVIKRGFTAGLDVVKSAFRGVLGVFLGVGSGMLKGIETIVRAASKVPIVGKRFRGLADDLKATREGLDHYRDSLRDADKEAGRTDGIKKLKGELRDARDRLSGLRKGSKEYRATAEDVRKKQRELNAALRATKPAARTAAGGIRTIGGTVAGLGSAEEGLVQYTSEQVNKLLKDFGAKPLHHKAKSFELGQRVNPFSSLGSFDTGARGGVLGGRPAFVSSGEVAIYPDGTRRRIPGNRTRADNVGGMFPPNTAILTDQGQALEAAGLGLGEILRRQVPHFAGGGMVRVPGDPDDTGGRDKVNPAIVDEVSAFIRKYRLNVGYAFDPGHHQSAGHNVTGTATDVYPAAGGSWDLLERGLRAFIHSNPGNQVLYGTHGIGTPYPNHGRGNHAHIEWGGAKGVAAAITTIKRLIIEGGNPVTRGYLQGVGDRLRRAGNAYLSRHSPSVSPHSGGPDDPGGWHGINSPEEFIPFWNKTNPDQKQWASTFAGIVPRESTWDPHAGGPGSGNPTHAGWYQFDAPTWSDFNRGGGGWPEGPYNPYYATLAAGNVARREGRRGIFSRWAQTVSGRTGGLIEAFRAGGLVGGTGTLTKAGRHARGKWRHVVAAAEQKISNLGKDYDLANRRFERTDETLINEGDTTHPPTYNLGAIAQRADELERLIAIRRRVVTEYTRLEAYLGKLVELYTKQQARLSKTVAGIRAKLAKLKGRKGKEAKHSRDGLEKRLGTYTHALEDVRTDLGDATGKATDTHYERLSAKEDVVDLRTELNPLLATLGRRAGTKLELPEFTPPEPATPDATPAGAADDGTPATSPLEVAAQARAQFAAFNEARAELYSSFGSNFQRVGGTGLGNLPADPVARATVLAAGLRDFGVLGSDQAPGAGGPVKLVKIDNHFPVAPDPHTWAQQQAFEAEAAF